MTSVADCMRAVEARFQVPLLDLVSERRARVIARPRHVAMWLARHTTEKSLPQIARSFKRDHTTVIYALETIDRVRGEDAHFRAITDQLRQLLMPKRRGRPAPAHSGSASPV